jgi:hypothetical protein
MARPENVAAVISAISTVYRSTGTTRPSKSEIIAISGVAHKTFYRVLQDHPEVKHQLELAEAIFDRRPQQSNAEVSHDPLKAKPQAAISELLDTIAKLTEVIESQRKRIRALEKQIGTAPSSISETETHRPRPRRYRKYKLSRL